MLSDTSYIANRLSWKGCIVFGVFSFVLFYFLIPMWLDASIKSGVIDFAYVVSFMGQDGSLSNEQIEFKTRIVPNNFGEPE